MHGVGVFGTERPTDFFTFPTLTSYSPG